MKRPREFNPRDRSIQRNTFYGDIDLKNYFAAATCEGWWVFVERQLGQTCFLWNPDSLVKINLAYLHRANSVHNRHIKFILTAPPTSPQCMVFILDKFSAKVLFCRLGDTGWTAWNYDYDQGGSYILRDAITCNGKLYAYKSNGTLCEFVIGPDNDGLHVERYIATVPSRCLFMKPQLVESCGELFLVTKNSILDSIFDADVFKLDFSQDKWEKVSNLGDRYFFLIENYSASVCTAELGISGNKIYFTENDDDESLYAFNLEDKGLSVYPNSGTFWVSHDKMLSALRLSDREDIDEVQIIHNQEKIHEEAIQESEVDSDDEENIGESMWFKLDEDVQKLIAQHLPTVLDYINFRAVCKKWRSLVLPIQWKPNYGGVPLKHPWLMFSQGEKGKYSFYDPICNLTHRISIPELEGCEIRFSKQGWLLVTKAPNSIFFFEPFTRTRIQLPDLSNQIYWFDGICFSNPPTSSDWQIFGITAILPGRIGILYLLSSSQQWTYDTIFFDEAQIFPSYANLVFDGECFCCLAKTGNLIFIKLSETHSSCSFDVSSSALFLSSSSRRYLVCYENELILVFLGQMGRSTHVLKLDRIEHKWVEVRRLEKEMLYLSHTTCLGVKAMEQKMKNTIQFAMFSDINKGGNISYSLKNRRYQYKSRQVYSSLADLYDSKELLRATWIQPLVASERTSA